MEEVGFRKILSLTGKLLAYSMRIGTYLSYIMEVLSLDFPILLLEAASHLPESHS